MKTRRAEITVAGISKLLWQSRLLNAEEVQALEERWQREAHTQADLEAFARWLVGNEYVTEYQVALLLQGNADRFFLDHYKLLDRVARGRLATVFKAVHRLGHLVAIKVLPPSKAREPLVLARFQREAQLAQRLQHPHVVRTFHPGEDKGLHYIVMEYLEGETLQQSLERSRRLALAEALPLFAQALQGLDYLHGQGLIHRNLEPANLMLVRSAETNRPAEGPVTVKILDISLGRSAIDEAVPEGEHVTRMTFEGLLLGIPAYLAPEQARDAHGVDQRADIYSLGCMLYHCLAGQPPFMDSNPLRQLIRHATEPPPSLRALNAEVPEPLEAVIVRMLAKDPAERYQNAAEVSTALLPFLAGPTASIAVGETVPAMLSDVASEPGALPQEPIAPAPARVEIDLLNFQMPAETSHDNVVQYDVRSDGPDYCYMLLGALGVVLAELLGWLLGYIVMQ